MRMYIYILVATLASLMAGCGMNETKPVGKNFTYDCSGAGKGWGDCREKADAQCGANHYTIISGEGDAAAKSPGGNTEMKRTLVVACK